MTKNIPYNIEATNGCKINPARHGRHYNRNSVAIAIDSFAPAEPQKKQHPKAATIRNKSSYTNIYNDLQCRCFPCISDTAVPKEIFRIIMVKPA